MKYIHDSDPPVLELSRRNINTLLAKLNDPFSARMLGSPGRIDEPHIMVKAVEDSEHYSDRAPGEIYMPGGDDPWERLIEQMKDNQHRVCAYGTREGDGKMCDCKYTPRMFLSEDVVLRGETTGCCELRAAIQILEVLRKNEEQRKADDADKERWNANGGA